MSYAFINTFKSKSRTLFRIFIFRHTTSKSFTYNKKSLEDVLVLVKPLRYSQKFLITRLLIVHRVSYMLYVRFYIFLCTHIFAIDRRMENWSLVKCFVHKLVLSVAIVGLIIKGAKILKRNQYLQSLVSLLFDFELYLCCCIHVCCLYMLQCTCKMNQRYKNCLTKKYIL